MDLSVKYSDVLYGLPVINDPSRPDYNSDYLRFFAERGQMRIPEKLNTQFCAQILVRYVRSEDGNATPEE